MKINTRALLAGFAGICLAGAVAGNAADVTVGADLNSSYVWRGLTFNDGFVIQPSVDVSGASGVGLNVWTNFDLDDYDGAVESGEFSEVDLTLYYNIPVESFDLSIGVIEYTFPYTQGDGVEGTREVYVDASKEFVEGLSGGAFLTYDFDEVDDVYGNVSLAYGMDINEQFSMELGGLLGFAGSDFSTLYAGGTGSGLFEYQVALSAAYAVSEVVELGAFIAYTDTADEDALPKETVDINTYGGFSAYYSF